MKINKSTLSSVLFILLISGGLFYWFQVRPAQIKHDCSWVRHFKPAKAAEPPMTESQLWEKGLLKECGKEKTGNIFTDRFAEICESENTKVIEEFKNGKLATRAEEWWEKAEEDEYKFCLHDKGL